MVPELWRLYRDTGVFRLQQVDSDRPTMLPQCSKEIRTSVTVISSLPSSFPPCQRVRTSCLYDTPCYYGVQGESRRYPFPRYAGQVFTCLNVVYSSSSRVSYGHLNKKQIEQKDSFIKNHSIIRRFLLRKEPKWFSAQLASVHVQDVAISSSLYQYRYSNRFAEEEWKARGWYITDVYQKWFF